MNVLEYKCPNCGGAITFSSASQQMICGHCGASFDPEALRRYDEEMRNSQEESYGWNEYDGEAMNSGELSGMRAYSCPSCGGEIVGDKNTVATSCPYCGNPAILQGKLSGMLRPDCLIPFKLDKAAAKQALTKHLKGKPLLPKLFKTQNRLDSITGIYVPFWLFGCDTHARIRYRATQTKSWSDSKYNYTRTDYYQLIREGDVGFANVPVDGSQKMDDAYMEAIEPFDYNQLTGFQSAYLAGYLADKYDVDAERSKARANERVKRSTEAVFASTAAGYTTCVPESTNIQFSNGSVQYALMPVWMLNTKYKDKMYTFAMNGQTGRLVGELPVSWGKFWAWIGGISVGLTVVVSVLLLLAVLA